MVCKKSAANKRKTKTEIQSNGMVEMVENAGKIVFYEFSSNFSNLYYAVMLEMTTICIVSLNGNLLEFR